MFLSVCRVPGHLSQFFENITLDGFIKLTVPGNEGRNPLKETLMSDCPWTHLLMATDSFLFFALSSFRAPALYFIEMAFLAALLPDPGVATDDSLAALSAANADRCFVSMSRKRLHSTITNDGENDQRDAYTTAAHMLFAQPVDAVGQPIKLSKSEIDTESATLDIMKRLTVPALSPNTGELLIRVATVDDDNAELVFDRPGIPYCSRGKDCIAHMIEGPPSKPLNAYRGVGHDPDCNECLLCIRHHLGMLVQMHRTHGSKPPVGILPPFCNVVDVAGGYHSTFCGVTPDDVNVIAGAVHIMGGPVSFRKVYSPYSLKWYVDQSAAVYGATGFFF